MSAAAAAAVASASAAAAAAAIAAVAKSPKPTHFRVMMHRSIIALPKDVRNQAIRNGFKKRNTVRYLPINMRTLAFVLNFRHLMRVDNVLLCPGVTPEMAEEQEVLARKPYLGFRVLNSDYASARPWSLKYSAA